MKRPYKPGVCNIGMRNRLLRFAYGIFFFSLGVWGWALIVVNHFPPVFKVALFIPFHIGFLGIYQSLSGFCVFHSYRHTHDMR